MRELAVFSRQFATLVASGMPMLRTLQTLEEQTEDELLKEAIAGVRDDVEAGSSLEQAMERHPKVFDRLFRSMVRSGEQSGRLDEALDRIAFQLEKIDTLRRQVRSALMYPAFVFGFAIVVLVAVVTFVVPVFVDIFERARRRRPRGRAPSCRSRPRSASPSPNALTGYWYILFPALIALVVAFFAGRRPIAGATSGTGSSCGSRSRSATSSRRSRWRAGRAPSPARSPPACRCCRRSS